MIPTTRARHPRRHLRHAGGYSLIELSIATAVGLFLLGGLLTILQNMRRTQDNQTRLAQLQDNERLAMTLITDIVQAAGYFPDPTTQTLVAALPAMVLDGATMTAGQALHGTHSDADPGDTITARFATQDGDTIINCIGGTNTSASAVPVSYVNTFRVSNGQLVCSLNGGPATPLISGVTRIDVRYGVKRDLTSDNNNIDTYLLADQLSVADWNTVTSVKVRLTFKNPLAGQGKQADTIQFTRTIAVMARAGVKI